MSINAQKEFDDVYVTSTEIAKELQVSRVAICQAVGRGFLPEPIKVNDGQITLFNRVKVKPYVDAWKFTLSTKRAIKNER